MMFVPQFYRRLDVEFRIVPHPHRIPVPQPQLSSQGASTEDGRSAMSMSVYDELFSCVTFSDTRAVFGTTTGSILLGRVPSTRRRVHWVGPWPPSTSNNHRCTDAADNHRSVGSDVRATHVRLSRGRRSTLY
ncbi:hypothetical protein THAOC_09828 [Thalassiosira oceanica]|uniref:Uncharacterized protein n=1 Tax=Thalassiosira oceanica TaxID=159749 RepID=K0SU62_THAOC|nr:hypothetical protein THAOC_09828 [Thalassiosira oceanica]|eukprot:EJK68960.1 hypothetical protein THAOC_09828 [Thalassiosira oceanica]